MKPKGRPITPQDVGLSASRLACIREVFRDHIDKDELAGAVAMISRKARVVYFEPSGMLYVEHFTLNDPVSKFVPAFRSKISMLQSTAR